MTTSHLLRRLQKLERQGPRTDIPWHLYDFKGGDPDLEALGDREMTSEEWVRWARSGMGLPPRDEVEA